MPFGISAANVLKYLGPKWGLMPTVQGPRRPTVNDKQFPIQTFWRVEKNPQTGSEGEEFILVRFDSNGDAIWQQLALSASGSNLDTLSGDSGTDPIVPDGAGNIAIVGDATQGSSTVGGTNELTITIADATDTQKGVAKFNAADFTVTGGSVSLASSSIVTQFTGNSGTAVPTAGNVNVLGDGTLLSSSASGSTITFNLAGSLVNSISTNSGTVTPSGNAFTISGTAPITVTGSGATATVALSTPLSVAYGGTGLSTVNAGDIIYASALDTFSRLAKGSDANFLTLASGIPAWAAPGPTNQHTGQTSWSTGDLLYASAANTLSKLTIGSTDQVLTVSGGIPAWSTSPSGIGSPTVATASSDATIEFTGLDGAEYLLILENVKPATDAVTPRLRVSDDNGSSWVSASNYRWYMNTWIGGTTTQNTTENGNDTEIRLGNSQSMGNGSGEYGLCGWIKIQAVAKASTPIQLQAHLTGDNNSANLVQYLCAGSSMDDASNATTAVNGIQFYFDSGNVASGKFYLYKLSTS